MRRGSRRRLRVLERYIAPILDVILPLKPQSARTKERTLSDLPLSPMTHFLRKQEITTLFPYHDHAAHDAIRALKFEGSYDAARLLALALADYLEEEIASHNAFSPRPILLIPVPLHKDRLRERGFNQIERVLDELPEYFHDGTLTRLGPDALARPRSTPHQTSLSRAERLRNVSGAFVADHAKLAGTHAIIIDDVCTTGATLAACAKAANKTGATTTLLALARA